MLRNTTKPLLFIFGIALASACAGDKNAKLPSPIEPAWERSGYTSTGKTYASLVTSEQTRQFPHLQRHQGQIMLGNPASQILLPVVSPMNSPQSYFPLITKVYRLEDGKWHESKWLPRMEINLLGSAGKDLQLIGHDISQDGQGTLVQSFFRDSAGQEAHVLVNIAADYARMDVRVQAPKDKISWRLRISRGLGEEQLIPSGPDRVAGLTSSLLPEVMSIIGDQGFLSRQDATYSYLQGPQASEGGRFKVLFDRSAALHQAQLVEAAIACSNKPKNSPPCVEIPRAKSSLTLSMPSTENRSDNRLWQQISLYTKQGSFRSLLPIREGESLVVPLPLKEKLEVFVPDSEGLLKKLVQTRKNPGKLQLPEMERGTLALNSREGRPSFVELRDAIQDRGRALATWLPIPEADLLSPNTFLQTKWPLTTALPAGDYEVKVFNGTQVLCQQRVTIRPNKRQTLDCSGEDNPQSEFSPRASLSLDSSKLSPDFLAAAHIKVATSNTPNINSALILEIPSIDVYDADVGLSLRAFPATVEILKAWETVKRERRSPPGLHAFVDFVRGQSPLMDIVLDCPSAGFQLSEYRWIALSLKPDIMEVFGCQQPELAQDLLQIAHRLQQKVNKPIRLAAASLFRSLYQSQIPAIYLSHFKSEATAEGNFRQVMEDIQNGDYTLGLRTELLLTSALPARGSQQLVRLKVRSFDPKLKSAVLRIHDQNEMLREETVHLAHSRETDISIQLSALPSSRWLRFELLGRDNGALIEEALLPLATSNFLSLDGTPKVKF